MLVEVAKPVTLISCILSLFAVFHTAFLAPSSEWIRGFMTLSRAWHWRPRYV